MLSRDLCLLGFRRDVSSHKTYKISQYLCRWKRLIWRQFSKNEAIQKVKMLWQSIQKSFLARNIQTYYLLVSISYKKRSSKKIPKILKNWKILKIPILQSWYSCLSSARNKNRVSVSRKFSFYWRMTVFRGPKVLGLSPSYKTPRNWYCISLVWTLLPPKAAKLTMVVEI